VANDILVRKLNNSVSIKYPIIESLHPSIVGKIVKISPTTKIKYEKDA
jgi:hypothetical protein